MSIIYILTRHDVHNHVLLILYIYIILTYMYILTRLWCPQSHPPYIYIINKKNSRVHASLLSLSLPYTHTHTHTHTHAHTYSRVYGVLSHVLLAAEVPHVVVPRASLYNEIIYIYIYYKLYYITLL